MRVEEIDHANDDSDSARYPDPQNVARMIVINNSQIVLVFHRVRILLIGLFPLAVLAVRYIPKGALRDRLEITLIAFIPVILVILLLGYLFDRALRRCPVCRTRITKATDEKRRCLECGAILWDSWDEDQ